MTGLLYLLALIPLVLSQVEPTRDPPVDDELPVEPTRGGPGPDDGGDCVDEYSNLIETIIFVNIRVAENVSVLKHEPHYG